MPPADGLVVFSDDWGRHPSSCQHLVKRLLPRYRTRWFNTIGTRRPRADLLTLRRGFGKIAGWMKAARQPAPSHASDASDASDSSQGDNPLVVDPVMWPSFASWAGRQLNARVLRRAVAGAVDDPERFIGVTTLPIVADLVGRVPLARWVYYCVDDLAEWPGLDRGSLQAMEAKLVERVDAVVAVSEHLVERMAGLGREAELLTHGVDPDFWIAPGGEVPAEIAALEPPLVVFWGVVDRRLASDWIATLAGSLERGTVVLVGPPNNPDPSLVDLDRVVQTGSMPMEALPAIAAAAAALVMPYADMEATRAIQPLKLKEYLATGLPVVVSDLPACREWHDACDIVDSGEVFSWKVLTRIADGVPSLQQEARERLVDETWERKAESFERVLTGDGTG